MIKKIALALALVVASIIPAQADAGGNGLFSRLAANRAAARQAINTQRVVNNAKAINNAKVQKIVVQQNNNRHKAANIVVERVVVDQYGRQIVQRNVKVQQQRQLRIVEVPNLNVQNNLLVVRDQHGRVLEVRRQNVTNIQRNQKQVQKGNRIIIQQNAVRGY